MAEKIKRGRRALPKTEKKHKIIVFVKAKNHAKATAAAKELERKYNTSGYNKAV